jgi:chromosome segregation ATPase
MIATHADNETCLEELELALHDKEELMVKARSALEDAGERRRELEQKNTELEVVIQQLNESIGALDERLLAAENEYQEREAQCEAMWEGRVAELTAQLTATQC